MIWKEKNPKSHPGIISLLFHSVQRHRTEQVLFNKKEEIFGSLHFRGQSDQDMYYVNHDLIIFFLSLIVFIVVGFILGFFMGYTCIWSTFYGVTIDTLFRRLSGRATSRKAICGSNLVTKLVHRLPVLVSNDVNNTNSIVNTPIDPRSHPTSVSISGLNGVNNGDRQNDQDLFASLPSPPPSYFQSNFASFSQYNGLSGDPLAMGGQNGLESPKDGPEYIIIDSTCCSNVHCQQMSSMGMAVMSPLSSTMSNSSSTDQIPLYQRDRDFASMPPIGSAEAEFQNDFISVFPMRHLHPQPDLR